MKIKLRNLRLKQNMSLRDLEKASGIDKSTISRIENNLISPSADVLCSLSKALNVTLIDLVDCEEGE